MTRRWRRLCAAALLAAACSPAPDPVARTEPVPACTALAWDGVPRRRNLVLIVNDTMRRDRLGAYGGRARTPAFDAFAAGGFHLTRMSSQAPWTKPSIATLFTGLYPSQHGLLTHPALPEPGQRTLRDHREETDVLAEEAVTMAEVLRDAGYRTAAFVANPWMKRRFGFAQGFDVYEDTFVQGWHVPGALIVFMPSLTVAMVAAITFPALTLASVVVFCAMAGLCYVVLPDTDEWARPAPPGCPHCGYDTTGLTQCPECGAAVEWPTTTGSRF